MSIEPPMGQIDQFPKPGPKDPNAGAFEAGKRGINHAELAPPPQKV